MNSFRLLLRREYKLAFASLSDIGASLLFFILPPFLLSLGIALGEGFELRASLAVLYVTAALALITGLDRLFRSDWHNGYLDHLRVGYQPLLSAILAKTTVFWLFLAVPLIVTSPVVLWLLSVEMDARHLYGCWLIMAIFSGAAAFIGTMMAAIALSARQAQLLLFVLLLPLLVPLLIFAIAASEGLILGHGWYPPFAALLALLLISAMLCPLVTRYCLELLD